MPSVPNLKTTNVEWVAGLKSGRRETTESLRTRIRAGLGAALAGRAGVSEADLDDFTQDALLRVIDRVDSFRGDSSFTTWAMAVAVRVSMTALRRRRWATVLLDERLGALASMGSAGRSAAGLGERAELFGALRSAIDTALTPRQRQVLLAELEGIPQVVLAERLSSTPGAVYKVSHDARKKIKAALARAGFDTQTVQETLANER